MNFLITNLMMKKAVGYPKIYKWDYENNKLVSILDPKGTVKQLEERVHLVSKLIFWVTERRSCLENEDDTELRIYTTTDLTDHKFYTFMHDSVYRLSVAFKIPLTISVHKQVSI